MSHSDSHDDAFFVAKVQKRTEQLLAQAPGACFLTRRSSEKRLLGLRASPATLATFS